MLILLRQFTAFFGVGLVAAVAHFGTLVGLVERAHLAPVPATLWGYVFGGVTSYLLNRRHTYASDRPHREAGWRFGMVALVGFGVTYVLMSLFTGAFGWPYLPAQILTTGVVLGWSFFAHKVWTFGPPRPLV